MSNIKVLNNLNIKEDAYISGSQKLITQQSFSSNITTSSAGMYDINSAFHAIDTKIVDNNQIIKRAYEAARYKYTGSFDLNGDATINLTSLATSGSTYFSADKLDNIDVQILLDSAGDLHYRNDLVSVQLYASGQNLFLELSSPAAASKNFRILAINEIDFITNASSGQQEVIVVISDWYQEAVLSSSYAINNGDNFGNAVAMSSNGSRIAVAAYGDELPGYTATGLVYVYNSSSAGWNQSAILSSSNTSSWFGEDFDTGEPVAMTRDGNKIAVSAIRHTLGSAYGVLYLFNSSSIGWNLETSLTKSSGFIGPNAKFNYAGNKLFSSNNGGGGQGVITVFSSASNGWRQEANITGSISGGIWAGTSIAINSSSNILVAGAYRVGVNGQNDVGITYIFTSSSSGWSQQTYLTGTYAIQSDDYFGYCVDINHSGNIIAVGAPQDEITSSFASGSDLNTGLVYLFNSESNGWRQTAILTGSVGRRIDTNYYYYPSYGPVKVKLNPAGNKVLASARTHSKSPAPSGDKTGLSFVFASSSGGWNEQKVLSGSFATQDNDDFGYSLAWSEDTSKIVIGARNDETGSNQNGGLAYVYKGI